MTRRHLKGGWGHEFLVISRDCIFSKRGYGGLGGNL